MKSILIAGGLLVAAAAMADPPLGLPPVPIPADNPQTAEKIALGEKLFLDTRFSVTGDVSCSTCHEPERAREGVHRQPPENLGRHPQAHRHAQRAYGRQRRL